jgi:hypothetical protein
VQRRKSIQNYSQKTFKIAFINKKSGLYIKELDFSAEETLLR